MQRATINEEHGTAVVTVNPNQPLEIRVLGHGVVMRIHNFELSHRDGAVDVVISCCPSDRSTRFAMTEDSEEFMPEPEEDGPHPRES